MIIRDVGKKISEYLASESRKILFIWGPRRSGKTTLLKKIAGQRHVPIFNFDLLSDREKFITDREVLSKLAKALPLILIDEVQNYPEATVALKALHDEFKVKIIATGSNELRQKNKHEFDTLSGRFMEEYCLPLSVSEIVTHENPPMYDSNKLSQQLGEQLQIFGSYPEIYDSMGSENQKIDELQKIVETYVLKDVIDIYNLKNIKLARDILLKVALQTGQEVSLREIANSLQANVSTVSNYIEIFIKNYVLIPLPSFKANMRRAVSENRKLYFYDLGIRNALIRDFRKTELRPDKGGLFENFIITEVEKMRRNKNLKFNLYFYREYGGKEVDLVLEDFYKKYVCFEIKYSQQPVKSVFPLPHKLHIITPENYFHVLQGLTHE